MVGRHEEATKAIAELRALAEATSGNNRDFLLRLVDEAEAPPRVDGEVC